MSELTKQDLIEAQQHILKKYEDFQEDCPYELVRTLKEIVNVQKRVLHELGYRKPLPKKKAAPPKNFFKRKTNDTLLPADNEGIQNETPTKDIFSKKSVVETAKKGKGIQNETPKTNPFKAKEVVKSKDEKANPRRLNQKQIADIKEQASKGLNIKQISDLLMIEESKVSGVLKAIAKKGGGNLLATNQEDSIDKFKAEIKASKE